MAIKFECECGKVLTAQDGSEGKRARCPACRRMLLVPAALRLDAAPDAEAPTPSEATGGIRCPNCGQPMATEAVICIQCGFDRRTGAKAQPEKTKRRPGWQPRFSLRTVGSIAIGLGVLAAVWFFVLRPIWGKVRLNAAMGYVANGDLKKALRELESLQHSVGASDRERVQLWIRQIQLELDKNTGKVLDDGIELKHDAVALDVRKKGFPGGAILVAVSVTNKTKAPLTLREQHFYVRGISDIVLVSSGHSDNTIEGLEVPPGQTKEGNIAFRKMPNHPVRKGKGAPGIFESHANTYFYLSFNDGTHYVKRVFPF